MYIHHLNQYISFDINHHRSLLKDCCESHPSKKEAISGTGSWGWGGFVPEEIIHCQDDWDHSFIYVSISFSCTNELLRSYQMTNASPSLLNSRRTESLLRLSTRPFVLPRGEIYWTVPFRMILTQAFYSNIFLCHGWTCQAPGHGSGTAALGRRWLTVGNEKSFHTWNIIVYPT